MKSLYNILGSSCALMLVPLYVTLGFAQSDNITIKRTIGDYYDITIFGERSGDYAELQLVTTNTYNFVFDNTHLMGLHPRLEIYAYVTSGGDTSNKSTYSTTFQKQIFGAYWIISYYVADSHSSSLGVNPVLVKNIWFPDSLGPDYDEGYHFDLDLTDSTFEPQPEGAFKIRNLNVEGYEESPIWATFKWNPRNVKFEFVEAGNEE